MKLNNSFKSGVIFSLTSISIFAIVGITYAATVSKDQLLTADLFNRSMVPTGAVMSFALSDCPIGWSDYLPAQGRFIRGIDKTGTNIDPDGERAFGSIQEDKFKSHDHRVGEYHQYRENPSNNSSGENYLVRGNYWNTPEQRSGFSGGDETRPKNVALLYCIKN